MHFHFLGIIIGHITLFISRKSSGLSNRIVRKKYLITGYWNQSNKTTDTTLILNGSETVCYPTWQNCGTFLFGKLSFPKCGNEDFMVKQVV